MVRLHYNHFALFVIWVLWFLLSSFFIAGLVGRCGVPSGKNTAIAHALIDYNKNFASLSPTWQEAPYPPSHLFSIFSMYFLYTNSQFFHNFQYKSETENNYNLNMVLYIFFGFWWIGNEFKVQKRMMKTKYENKRTHVNTHSISLIRVTVFPECVRGINTTAHAADARI